MRPILITMIIITMLLLIIHTYTNSIFLITIFILSTMESPIMICAILNTFITVMSLSAVTNTDSATSSPLLAFPHVINQRGQMPQCTLKAPFQHLSTQDRRMLRRTKKVWFVLEGFREERQDLQALPSYHHN